MFECVINISEGCNSTVIDALTASAGASWRDTHSDAFHNRSVFTLINTAESLENDVRRLITTAVHLIDLRAHTGVHPRFGVVDVVPFVALSAEQVPTAIALRDATGSFLANELDVPVFFYGPVLGEGTRTLPTVRRNAFRQLSPDLGSTVDPRRGASAVGSRDVLVAWNLWISGISLATANAIAKEIRAPELRALGFEVGTEVQVSCNLIDVNRVRPSDIFDRVSQLLPTTGHIVRAELVGLVPRHVLDREDPRRWSELGLTPERTIEFQLGR